VSIDDLSPQVGRRVREERKARKLTLAQLAELAGLSARFVGEVERGRANPSLGSLGELAAALEVPLISLLMPAGPEKRTLLSRLSAMSEADARRALDAMQGAAGRPLALLGLRGAGKSTVGRRVAEHTGRPFVEVNQRIEAEAGMPLGSLFELHGEAYYRELEHRVLTALLQGGATPAVLEVSGGAVTHAATWRLILKGALTVWLKATPQEHWDRVIAQGDERPMDGRDRARLELEELYTRRSPHYAEAEVTVVTTDRPLEDVVGEVVALVA
jgi:XRE family aerobic/anaerobic benzoate catabolism transcriptional regulator